MEEWTAEIAWLWPALQWLIDTTGKLGPAIVAWLVYDLNRRQAERTNAIATHAAEIEDQKFRLALIERRSRAYEAVTSACQEVGEWGLNGPDLSSHLYSALREAELVFDATEEEAINRALSSLRRWQYLMRTQVRWDGKDDEKSQAARDEAEKIDENFGPALAELTAQLQEATRVSAVAPIIPA